LFTFWGVTRIIRPGRNDKGVSSHADGSKKEGQEEDGQEEDEEGEEEEVACVDTVNVVFERSVLTADRPSTKAKAAARMRSVWKPRPSPHSDLDRASARFFSVPAVA
jgi:hypothetical protein